jgi:hypothetical protein
MVLKIEAASLKNTVLFFRIGIRVIQIKGIVIEIDYRFAGMAL